MVSTGPDGQVGRSAIEVELTCETKGLVEPILRGLLAARYHDVIYFAVHAAASVVKAAAVTVGGRAAGPDPALPAPRRPWLPSPDRLLWRACAWRICC